MGWMNADSSGQMWLTNDQVSQAEPALSPDGTRLAFDTNGDGNQEIYVMHVDGAGAVDLIHNPGWDEAPA